VLVLSLKRNSALRASSASDRYFLLRTSTVLSTLTLLGWEAGRWVVCGLLIDYVIAESCASALAWLAGWLAGQAGLFGWCVWTGSQF
jgi:hypothetical protein